MFKVTVKYTVELTAQQRKDCLRYASNMGLGYDNPRPLILLKRLFKDNGESVILKALEARQEEDG